MYFVAEGKVGAYATGQGSGELHLKTIEEGGHFGKIGLTCKCSARLRPLNRVGE